MGIRKEQVLALLTLGVGALVAKSMLAEPVRPPTYNPTKAPYEATAVPPAVLAGASDRPVVRRDFCTEPSETRPLPPRELDFPPRQPLSVAAMPLPIGPDPGNMWLLRTDGAVVEGVALQGAGDAPAGDPSNGSASPADAALAGQEPLNSRAEREERAALAYDRIWLEGLKSPFFGTIEAEAGQDLFLLEERKDFEGVQIHLRGYNVDSGKVGGITVYGADARKIARVELARTLRNQVRRRIRAVPDDAGHLGERGELIEWLLARAREAEWVYDVALEQAKTYSKLSGGDIEGLRWQQRVLRTRGDLAAEWALLDGLAGEHRETAFRYESLGVLKAIMGLHADAEADLRHAVKLAPTDARPFVALAEMLRRSGRSREALSVARRIEQTFGSLLNTVDRARAVRTLVACLLAVGNIEDARTALQLVPAGSQPYLQGCIQYAAGQIPEALASFREGAGTEDSAVARLGQGACLVRQGAWQEAHDLLMRVADQEPLLRHRAATGLALLFSRLGQFDEALRWIDRALEADPQDHYAFYLRGRTLRLQGQLPAANEALLATLRLRDDFVHAIAEMAAVQSQRSAESRGEDQVQAAVAARRYGDRAVDLAAVPAVELFELQGIYHFRAANPRGAGEAFARARDLAPDDAGKLFSRGGLAIVDYSRGLVDDSATALQRLVEDLAKEDPMRLWAQSTLEAIDDHAQKELLEDSFDRGEVGSVWIGENDGTLHESANGEALLWKGSLTRGGPGEVFVERVGGVRKGKNFLAVGCTMQLGADQALQDSFGGLRIEMQRGAGAYDLRVQLGVRDGKPFLRIEDGRASGQLETIQQNFEVPGFDARGAQRLELRVVPRGDAQSRAFALQASWNGMLLYSHDLKTLTGNTTTELKTMLFVGGGKGSTVDVKFDDYRLERRKDATK